jgi:hypothetical protein
VVLDHRVALVALRLHMRVAVAVNHPMALVLLVVLVAAVRGLVQRAMEQMALQIQVVVAALVVHQAQVVQA